jgi:hypothetical protein
MCWRKKEEIPVAGKSYAIGSALAGQQTVCLDYLKHLSNINAGYHRMRLCKNAAMT